ncbi:hypothetical protein BGW36DRAFT_289550 [Talaromyces proteolyticus]|uniref:DNA/RNA-binding domain-containing protein n=1 Tax=Talaromyces proteolyticus TaxID=1131652 RepID=A0AAD4KW80_9EURO|nr:uncharacterized protein BGW36DRAFT_289550 [Talaromyces proteolyticus]KAH8702358.1 hypothetical protein BGW36DRAFT_289550 [Talaromyces proteolyticus]
MFLQPETHAITEEQLINEVRAIYAGLVMVEKKCIEIDKQQSNNADGLKELQWQALIALHRTLLHEHHDFFLASNHPAASVVLRKLADKYSMPARMWRYGIHSFLELLRKKLPASLEHMLSYIYMAYSMMTLLLESVPAFERTWIECLGDLARYRMAIEEIDMSERDKWSGVARQWYSKAADKSPEVGRIQHHLAVLARPNLLQQLFYYSKSLTSIQPFTNARDSIALVFGPLLDASKPVNKSNPEILIKFVKVHGLFFRRGEVSKALPLAKSFLDQLDDHIESVGAIFREQGVYISSSNYAAIFDYGQSDSKLFPMFDSKNLAQESKQEIVDAACAYWANPPCQQTAISLREIPENLDLRFHTSDHVASYASHLAFYTLELVLERIGDRDVLPYAHVSLAFLWCISLVPKSMEYIQADVPWARIASFLNSLIKSEKGKEKTDTDEFPVNETSKQLPEDFLIRGLAWSQLYYPEDFFDEIADEEERSVEAPSVVIPRTKRCLWLGLNIAKLNCWIKYDDEKRRFFATSFTEELAGLTEGHQVLSRHNEQHDVDTKMTGV